MNDVSVVGGHSRGRCGGAAPRRRRGGCPRWLRGWWLCAVAALLRRVGVSPLVGVGDEGVGAAWREGPLDGRGPWEAGVAPIRRESVRR